MKKIFFILITLLTFSTFAQVSVERAGVSGTITKFVNQQKISNSTITESSLGVVSIPTLAVTQLSQGSFSAVTDTVYTQGDSLIITKGIITGVRSTGTSRTKIYYALATQTGTNAPVVTVLQNTLGGTVVWTRTGVGVYTGTLAGAFGTGKTLISLNSVTFDFFASNCTGNNTVSLTTASVAGVSAADGKLINSSIKIIVYN